MKKVRHLISVVMAAVILFSALAPTAASAQEKEEKRFLLGDADTDGEVSVLDATAIQRHLANMQLLSFKGENLGDVDRNEELSIIDATLIQRYDAKLPAPEEIGEEVAPRTMVFQDGEAQPIIRWSDCQKADYTNTGSDVIRFTVYVETDYDTDLDGKPDLVKAWVQLPRPAAEGDYHAPVIYEARPYCAGYDMAELREYADTALDESELQNRPAKRIPAGSASLEQVSAQARGSDWYYHFSIDPNKERNYYSNLTTYDYYLLRGFAVVGCAGLGTYGSEGFELCGTQMEAAAFAAVVEWLHGDRIAYTDTEHNISVSADWSNGSVGMTGRSYAGAMAYEVAATGVDGLKTIVPAAGISSWYDYSNSQGAQTMSILDYASYLGADCASRFFEDYEQKDYDLYAQWMRYAADAQKDSQGRYSDIWAVRDFSSATELKASALIVQGLNDNNVCPKQFDLMWRAYENAGAEHKAILHQNDHMTPAYEANKTDIMIGDCSYAALLNRWFSHYLAGVENGVGNMPNLTVQSNIDGAFRGYDSLDAADQLVLSAAETDGETSSVTAVGALESNESLLEETFTGQASENAALWKTDVTDAITVKGNVQVHVRVKTDNIDAQNTTIAAALVDTADDPFDAFIPDNHLPYEVIGTEAIGEDAEPYRMVRWLPTQTDIKIITTGIMDLKTPNAGYLPQTAVAPEEPVQSGEWYDYTIYLQPTVYTVAKGHHLELYILPYVDGYFDDDIMELLPIEVMEEFGYKPDYVLRRQHDYSFTIDNTQSYAEIPIG